MSFRVWAPGLAASLVLSASLAGAAPTAPPGHNVHLVREVNGNRFWRGGAPRKDTVEALAAAAKVRGKTVTFIDLRKPANSDDRSGKTGRLSPDAEAAMAKKYGLRYVGISALDKKLPNVLASAVQSGDVYIHCMYGVNRTGFAVARYARAEKCKVPTQGLGKRDWKQGDAFQARIEKR